MTKQYVVPTHASIGDYNINDPIFNESALTVAIDNLQTSAAYLTGLVESIGASVDSLCIALDDALSTLEMHTENIDYLSSQIDGLALSALKHAIADVGILRPDDENQLYLKIDVFNKNDLTSSVGTIDMGLPADWKYFEALLVNNGESYDDPALSPLSPDYFPGTQWVQPSDIDVAIKEYSGETASFTGYGPAFKNSPVNIKFLDWINDKALSADLNAKSRFYLRFVWYYIDSNSVVHSSDHFSMVVPSYAEVGAKAGGSATRSEILELKQALEMNVATVHCITDDELDALAAEAGDAGYGLAEYSTPGFYVQPCQCTILEDFGSSVKNIILQSYAEGKTYKLKFKTGTSDVTVGKRATTTRVAFNANYGNGPEAVEELNTSTLTFKANTTYLIAVNLGMIQVIAQN